MQLISLSPAQTQKLARDLAKKILKQKPKTRAFVIGLKGNLGSGKTTFLQGFAKGMGIKEKITSPTFVILKRFKILDSLFKNFYHIDCYRFKNPKDIFDLGIKEILSDSGNIIAIEWPEKIKRILPQESVFLEFFFVGEKKRKIIFKI